MESEYVHLALFSISACDVCATFVVNRKHEFGGFLGGVAEKFLQHIGDVAHQIHWIVPHDDNPFALVFDPFGDIGVGRGDGVG